MAPVMRTLADFGHMNFKRPLQAVNMGGPAAALSILGLVALKVLRRIAAQRFIPASYI